MSNQFFKPENLWKETCAFCKESTEAGVKHQCGSYIDRKAHWDDYCLDCGGKRAYAGGPCWWCKDI